MGGACACVFAMCHRSCCTASRPIEVAGLGSVIVDVAYGGHAVRDCRCGATGLPIEPHEARDLVAVGERIKAAAAEQLPSVHPENPQIHTVNQTLFAGPLAATPRVGRAATR